MPKPNFAAGLNKLTLIAALAMPLAASAVGASAARGSSAEAPSDERPFRTPSETEVAEGKERLAKAERETLTLEPGRALAIERADAAPGRPTLLLLPGVNRNLLLQEAAALPLAARGFGIATFALSVQPFSIAALPPGVRPSFRDEAPTLESFAREAEAVAAWLAGKGVARTVPVTLSYSGAFSPHLRGFSEIIDSVPMTSARAASPDVEAIYGCERFNPFCLNPFLKPGIVRSSLDLGYAWTWSRQADAMIRQFGLRAERRDDMIKGYTSMSLAAEEASWSAIADWGPARRTFVIAGKEGGGLLANQLAAFERIRASRGKAVLVVIEESGHVIPAEQPVAYAEALDRLTHEGFGVDDGVVALDSKAGSWRARAGSAAAAAIEELKRRAQTN